MKAYMIKRIPGSIIIIDRATKEQVAEYRTFIGREAAEIAAVRRALDKHLATPNGTLGNYQF